MPSLASVALTLKDVLDQAATFTITFANASPTPLTLVKAYIVWTNDLSRPQQEFIVDIPETETKDAIPNFTNLVAGLPVDFTIKGLSNGVPKNFRAEVILRDGSNAVSIINSSNVEAIPIGVPDRPTIITTLSAGVTSFIVRVARHTNDGGNNIQKLIINLSRKNNDSGDVVNSLSSKVFDYSPMYTPLRTDADGNEFFSEYFDCLFNSSDGITSDDEFFACGSFANNDEVSPFSDAVECRPDCKAQAPTSITSIGSDSKVEVTFTGPANASVGLIRGFILSDEDTTDDKFLEQFYSYTGDSFVQVADSTSFGSGFPMKDSATKQKFIIAKLINNKTYTFKFAMVSEYGTGTKSAAFSVAAQTPPGPVEDLKIVRSTLSGADTGTLGASQNSLDSGAAYSKLIPFEFQFKDPRPDGWAISNTKYIITQLQADDNDSALQSALAKFSNDAARTDAEKLLPQEVVLQKIKTLSASKSYLDWNVLNASQKTELSQASPALEAALVLFYKIKTYVASTTTAANNNNVIVDNISASQKWSTYSNGGKLWALPAGVSVKFSVVPKIVTASGSGSDIDGPESVLEAIITESSSTVQPVFTATAQDSDIILKLALIPKIHGYKNSSYTISVEDQSSPTSGSSQSVTYTPQYDALGYPKAAKLSLVKDLLFAITNGVGYKVSASVNSRNDPFDGARVFFPIRQSGTTTPTGKADPIRFSTVVDTTSLRFQTIAPSESNMRGGDLSSSALDFYQVKTSDLPIASARAMTQDQLSAYLSGKGTALTIAGAAAVNDLDLGYIISQVDKDADKKYGQSITGNTAGSTNFLISRVNTGNASSRSDWAISDSYQYYAAPNPVTDLVVTNKDGALPITFKVPTNDGRGNDQGLNVDNYSVERWSGGVKEQVYTALTNSFTIPSFDTTIGKVYYIRVYAISKDKDTRGEPLSSTVTVSSPITSATALTLGLPTITADGRGVVLPVNNNGSIIKEAFIGVSTLQGKEIFKVLTNASNFVGLGNVSFTFTTGDGLADGDRVVSGIIVPSDSTGRLFYASF